MMGTKTVVKFPMWRRRRAGSQGYDMPGRRTAMSGTEWVERMVTGCDLHAAIRPRGRSREANNEDKRS